MQADFTLKRYRQLLESLKETGYEFITYETYCLNIRPERFVILRHDVDLRAANSLATARIEQGLAIRGTYYFRVVRQSNRPEIIRAIAELGHEIGYHYEDMALCGGNREKALSHFREKLAHFRQFYPVRTICMHGSPASKFDNKDLWLEYNYRDFGIIGEPYFDTGFDSVFYLTDTGRMWDGDKYSIRDKTSQPAFKHLRFHTTREIIQSARGNQLPSRIMITVHPQRWTNHKAAWLRELVMQSLKNQIKRFLTG